MRAICLAAFLLIPLLCNAAKGEVPGRTLPSPPKIDGTIGDDEWSGASTFSGLADPDTALPVEEGGDFWLAYDERFIYFAARLTDHEPTKIQATEYRTNVGLRSNDSVTLQLDPFGRLSDFSQFTVNPRGATNIQIAGGRAAKREWLGDIAAAGRITKSGWEVEARIPWSVMKLPGPGKRDLRFNVYRDFRRHQRNHVWAVTNGGRIENFGRWSGVQVPRSPERTLKLLPYLYSGFDDKDGAIANAGLDYRTELTERIDLVGSINPDFRNIENQVLSLDFSYFERLANESRPFFLEGGAFFRTSFDAPIFASQRIRGFDTGVKVFGKIDDQTDVGILDTVDFGNENSLVARVGRQLTARSNINAAFVSYDTPDLKNDATFLGYNQSRGPFNFYAQRTTTSDSDQGSGDRLNTGLMYNENGNRADLHWVRVDSEFLPRLGFAPETNFHGFSGGFGQMKPTRNLGLVEAGFGVNLRSFARLDGSPYREGGSVNTSLTWKDGTDLDFRYTDEKFHPFHDRVFSVGIERPRGDNYRRWSVDAAFGELGGAPYENKSIAVAYRPVATIQISGSQQWVTYQHQSRSQTILSASVDLGRDMSISGRTIYKDNRANGYLAFRRSGNRGAEYFLILGDPNASTWRTSVVLKMVVPFEMPLKLSKPERRIIDGPSAVLTEIP